MKLIVEALVKFIFGIVLVGAMLFIPAGGLDYTNAWLFMALLFLPILVFGAILDVKSPKLLEKRLNAKEKQEKQKGIVAASGLLFVVGFIVAGLDYRFCWTSLPNWVVVASSVVLLASYGLYVEVMRENAYLSRTIEIQDGQTVVDTGLYSVVRHPMYSATVLLFLSIPLVLGSLISLLCFLPYVFIISLRIKDEEALLERELSGYSEYKKRVKYRLIPFIW